MCSSLGGDQDQGAEVPTVARDPPSCPIWPEIDTAIADAVKGLLAHGYPWAEIVPARHHPPGRSAAMGNIILTYRHSL
jgi:hypothetical protein